MPERKFTDIVMLHEFLESRHINAADATRMILTAQMNGRCEEHGIRISCPASREFIVKYTRP
jgi:hypothetical protein